MGFNAKTGEAAAKVQNDANDQQSE